MAIDLSRAFDTVDHELLLREVSELPLNNKIKRFLFSCLRGRQTFVEFKGAKSKHRKMRQGVPQEVVLTNPRPPPSSSTSTWPRYNSHHQALNLSRMRMTVPHYVLIPSLLHCVLSSPIVTPMQCKQKQLD